MFHDFKIDDEFSLLKTETFATLLTEIEKRECRIKEYFKHMKNLKKKKDKSVFDMFPIYSELRQVDDFVFIKMETQGWRNSMEDFVLF